MVCFGFEGGVLFLTLSPSTSEIISLMSLPSFMPNSRRACSSSSIVIYLGTTSIT